MKIILTFFALWIVLSCGEIDHKVSGTATVRHELSFETCETMKDQKDKENCIWMVLDILRIQSELGCFNGKEIEK